MDTFAKRLAALMAEKNIKNIQLARDICTRQMVGVWLAGEAKPKFELLHKIAAKLAVDPYWLQTGIGERTPQKQEGFIQMPDDVEQLLSAWRFLRQKERASLLADIMARAEANREAVAELSSVPLESHEEQAAMVVAKHTTQPVSAVPDAAVSQKLAAWKTGRKHA